MSNIPAEFWESAAGRELAATLHESYWDALACLTAIDKALRDAGIQVGGAITTELEQAAQDVKTAHDNIATLNNRLYPDKIF